MLKSYMCYQEIIKGVEKKLWKLNNNVYIDMNMSQLVLTCSKGSSFITNQGQWCWYDKNLIVNQLFHIKDNFKDNNFAL